MRVAFLTNFVSPYRRPLLERLAATPGWDLRVFVNAQTEFDRSWEVDTQTLDVVQSRNLSLARRAWTPANAGEAGFEQVLTLHVPVGLYADLRRFRPDLIVSLELGPRSLIAATYARLNRVPLVLWSYQSAVSATRGKEGIRRALLRQADAVVGMGREARQVLRGWGVPEAKIFDAPNACDHEALAGRLAAPTAPWEQAAIQARYGHKKLALVVGRLVPLKGTARLLATWDQLPRELRDEWQLVFLGRGPQAELVDAHPEAERAPEVEPARVADWLAACDLHVFPSMGDVWGLVVNEAQQCGAPTLCSTRAACAADMIADGHNGLLYDPVAPDAAARLEAALRHADRAGLAAAGRESVRAFSQDAMAAGFRSAARFALSARSRSESRPRAATAALEFGRGARVA